jgi:hypothetical protein
LQVAHREPSRRGPSEVCAKSPSITIFCDAAIDYIAAASGATADTMINAHAVMAGGTLRKASPGNPAISHLDFEALEAAIPGGLALCV